MPQYVASIVTLAETSGISNQDNSRKGALSIIHYSKFHMKLALFDFFMKPEQLLASAKGWEISWIGDTGQNTGITAAGHSGWKPLLKQFSDAKFSKVLYVDVITLKSSFKTKPRYFTMLHAPLSTHTGTKHYPPHGGHIVNCAHNYGFRTYVDSYLPLNGMFADDLKWAISWIGIEEDEGLFDA